MSARRYARRMAESYDAILVGGGAIGTAAARTLAQRGRHTLLLERFDIAHARGSSGGPTRIFRLTYDHPEYVRMARLALDAWHELEDAADERLLITTAGLDIGPEGRSSATALEAAGEPFAYLAPDAVRERWPAVRVDADDEVFVQEDAGVIMSERTVRAQARLAAAAGVTILERTPVERIEATGIEATVHTAADTYRAPIVVVTAGPWAAPLLRTAGLDLPLVPSLEQVTYFELADASPLPTVIDWTVTPPSTPYTVPNPEDPGAFKIAFHMSGPSVDAEDGPFDPDPERVRRAVEYAPTRYAAPRATG